MSWRQQTDEQREDEMARDWDHEMSKEPLWWHFIEEWLKEQAGDRLR